MMTMWNRWLLLVLLPVLACQDLREGWLDGRLLVLPMLGGFFETLESGPGWEKLLSLLPGLLLFAGSLVSRESLGEGDALLLWSMGYVLPAGDCLLIACGGFWTAGIIGLLRCLFDRRGNLSPLRERLRRERMALVPVLAAVTALVVCCPANPG